MPSTSRWSTRRRLPFLLVLSLLAALLVAPAAPAARAQEGFDPVLAAALDGVLDQTVSDPNIPGALLLVAIPGKAPWASARGLADRDAGVGLLSDTRFGVGSITKLFVATVAMQLVQEGWLSLDQTVEQWLPGLVPGGERINVRMLLNHTSGLHDYLAEGFVQGALKDRGRAWSPQELVAVGVGRPPYFAPGAAGRWRYSNTNYVLLGLIVEQVTHNSLAHELRQRIIGPLGLWHTFFEPDEPPDSAAMQGYEKQRELTDGLNMSFAWGVGNISSNAADLARFAQALFGGELLRPETLATMHSFVAPGGAWDTANFSYGLGLMQYAFPSAQPTLGRGHTGALVGYRASLWFFPERGITIVAAANQMRFDSDTLVVRALDVLRAHGAL